MAYRIKGLPDVLGPYPTFDPMFTTPETIAGAPPVSARDSFARRLGLVLSDEARGAMSPEELAAVQGVAGAPDENKIMQFFAAIAAVLGPEQLRGAMYSRTPAGRRAVREEEAKGLIEKAETRVKTKKEEEYKKAVEGLMPTPEGAVPGYMSVGEARGRGVEVQEDRVTAAQAKIASKIEAAVTPLMEKRMSGKTLSAREDATLNWGLKVLQSLRPPSTGFLGQPMAPQPIPEFPGAALPAAPAKEEGKLTGAPVMPPQKAIDWVVRQPNYGPNFTGLVQFPNGQAWQFQKGRPVKRVK